MLTRYATQRFFKRLVYVLAIVGISAMILNRTQSLCYCSTEADRPLERERAATGAVKDRGGNEGQVHVQGTDLEADMTAAVNKFLGPLYPEYFEELDRIEGTKEYESLVPFHPVLTPEERARLLYTFHVFIRACKEHGLTYFLFSGSLIGAHRHHGMIPWDVDIDVMLKASQWPEVRKVFGTMPGFILEHSGDTLTEPVRFMIGQGLESQRRQPRSAAYFVDVFVDMFFFNETHKHITGITTDVQNMRWPRESIFPLSTAPFELWELPVPACTKEILRYHFGDVTDMCESYFLRFGPDRYRLRKHPEYVGCSKLHAVYPFVFRRLDARTGNMTEMRKIGRSVERIVKYAPSSHVCTLLD